MKGLNRLFDRLLGRQKVRETLADQKDTDNVIPMNRLMHRTALRMERKRGPGYTRAMRPGRRVERRWPS